jgi:CubicO group peptidase (beta-lactamase class C family)
VTPRRALAALTALALLALLPGRASGEPSLDDASDVEGFVAGFLEAEFRERRVPGAVFVLVRGDRVALARGLGVADLETRTPVDPGRTLFRVASVSKLFTATAAMQLVEQGRAALDDDVNRHLRGLRVPDAFGEPVRVRHLLTHTGGFDDRYVGMAAAGADAREPLHEHLARRLPRRVPPPGQVTSYSNYGIALLGALIEDATGRPFDVALEENVLRPLGMRRSSFAPDAALRADLATGYALRGAGHRALPYDSLHVAPAGALCTTGLDVARFLRAQLRGGAGDGARVLRPSTLAEMPHGSRTTRRSWARARVPERRHGAGARSTRWRLAGFASLSSSCRGRLRLLSPTTFDPALATFAAAFALPPARSRSPRAASGRRRASAPRRLVPLEPLLARPLHEAHRHGAARGAGRARDPSRQRAREPLRPAPAARGGAGPLRGGRGLRCRRVPYRRLWARPHAPARRLRHAPRLRSPRLVGAPALGGSCPAGVRFGRRRGPPRPGGGAARRARPAPPRGGPLRVGWLSPVSPTAAPRRGRADAWSGCPASRRSPAAPRRRSDLRASAAILASPRLAVRRFRPTTWPSRTRHRAPAPAASGT